MKFGLAELFAFAGSFGLVGPHAGYERELMLAGVKPIAMFGHRIGCEAASKDIKALEDIAVLDQAVAEGCLSKVQVYRPPQQSEFGRDAEVVHFYCQPGLEEDLHVVAEYHRIRWCNPDSRPELPKDLGLYLGYTPEDIALLENGGYDSLSLPMRIAMKSTHYLRKAARLHMCVDLTH